LNRPVSRGHDVGDEMLPYYGAPRHARVRTGGSPRARRAYGAATGRRVARRLQCTAGHGSAWERSAYRVVCGLRRRRPRARTPRRRGRVGAASRRDVVAWGAGRHEFVLLIPCLSTNNSQFLNRSVPNDEYESCRSSYPLPLSKRLYSVFNNRYCRKGLPTLNAAQFQ
jgi:hypothetical protein